MVWTKYNGSGYEKNLPWQITWCISTRCHGFRNRKYIHSDRFFERLFSGVILWLQSYSRRVPPEFVLLPYSGFISVSKVVSKAEVKAELERKDSNVPILLIIPLRLGLDQVNTVYINSIRYFLKSKECVGIMGGKPNQVLISRTSIQCKTWNFRHIILLVYKIQMIQLGYYTWILIQRSLSITKNSTNQFIHGKCVGWRQIGLIPLWLLALNFQIMKSSNYGHR